MWKESIESERGLVGEVLDVLLEITIEDGEEAQVIVLKGHKMAEMQSPNSIRRLMSFLSDQGLRDMLQDKALHT